MAEIAEYTEENIKTLEGVEHIRLRPGMYIGKLGDGSHSDDGIYVLIKEVIDNSIDEFRMGAVFRLESCWTAFLFSTRVRNTTQKFSKNQLG